MEAIDLSTTSGKKLEIEPPVKAPNKLAKTSAEEDPKKLQRVYLKCRL